MIEKPSFDPAQLKQALSLLPKLPPQEQSEFARLIDTVIEAAANEQARDHFMPFVKKMWPAFISGRHHKIMADLFERIASGELKRVCISMPPRHTKSEFGSYLLPAWYLGRFPDRKVIQTSHTAELAVGFGRKVRDLVDSEEYQRVFSTKLKADNKAAGRWQTDASGEYFAIGVGGRMTGKGADLLIIDDPHDEQEAAMASYNPDVFDSVYEWYTSGPRQRLQPGGAIVIIQTRWGRRDLVGRVLDDQGKKGADKWEVVEFPAILPSGLPLWPEFWPLDELLATKAAIDPVKWNAQYMQSPTGEEGAMVKRTWWKRWEKRVLPNVEFKIQSWDTAHRKTTRSDFSVCTTWGIFYDEEKRPNIIILDIFRDRVEFPDLKAKAMELYKIHEPDACIIEGKAAGDALIQEMRRKGIPLQSYTPSRGEDKIVRVNAVTDLFASGVVWAPYVNLVPGVEEMIEEFAEFPNGAHDDIVDAATLAMLRYRQGNFIRLDSDEEDEDFNPDLRADYY